MILFRQKVFSGFMVGAASNPTPFFSLPMFDRLLGSATLLSVEVVISDLAGSPVFNVDEQTSNTGNFWQSIQSSVINFSPTTTTFVKLATTTSEGGDLIRLAMTLTGASSSANVLVHVTGHGQQSWM